MVFKPRILVVEDDKYWIDHHRVALKNVDVDVEEAQTIKHATELVSLRPFAGIVVDLEIPGMKEGALGGFEIIETTRKLNRYTELIVITGHTEQEILDRVSKMNVGLVTKPVDHRELAISIVALIESWNRQLRMINRVLEAFLYSHTVLENRAHKRPAFRIVNEYDVQDLLHAILKPYFPDVLTEEYTLKRAGNTKRLDLVIRGLETVIETKIVRNKSHASKIADELDIDIRGYIAHPHCRRFFCYVYDPERYIKDPRAIENDLAGETSQNTKTIDVTVMIRPL